MAGGGCCVAEELGGGGSPTLIVDWAVRGKAAVAVVAAADPVAAPSAAGTHKVDREEAGGRAGGGGDGTLAKRTAWNDPEGGVAASATPATVGTVLIGACVSSNPTRCGDSDDKEENGNRGDSGCKDEVRDGLGGRSST